MKTCCRCKQPKELAAFSKHKAMKDGLSVQCKECDAAYYKTNKAAVDAKNRRNYYENQEFYKEEARKSTWAKDNPEKHAAKCARRRASKLERTPKWLTPEHLTEILEFYRDAKELQWLSDEPLHVDHIEPLQGENVSGLHVPWNLRVIPRSKNLAKGNRRED